MGSVPGRERGLFLRVMRGMNLGGCFGMMLVVFGITAFIRADRAACMGGGYRLMFW